MALKLTDLYTYVCRYTLNLPFIQLQKFNFQFFVQTISRINNFRRLQIILKNNFDDDDDQKNLVNESFFPSVVDVKTNFFGGNLENLNFPLI